ncbi:hypothetical protein P8936_03915 [Edaphobacter paludis]|uniref:TIGR03118 family protein n=1 Tax=Edaphobacter paludis TaxID=3035702 RepID=A0AAU7D8Y3_9BACT
MPFNVQNIGGNIIYVTFAKQDSASSESGAILAFDQVTGKYKGMLTGTDNNPINIDGLWAIGFGNDASAGPATTLYFIAGPDNEANGLLGTLTAVENVQGSHQ